MTSTPLKLVVLISGDGGNLQAMIDAIESQKINAKINCVISNKADAYGIERAEKHGLTNHVLPHNSYPDRCSFEEKLGMLIDEYQPDLVALAGFMRILGPAIVKYFSGRMINLHPSLLPRHRGLYPHHQVLESGDKQHGCTVHYVTEGLDEGPIIRQMSLDVLPDDTPDSLKQRVKTLELQLYTEVIGWFAQRHLRC